MNSKAEEAVFEAALALPPEQRAAYLDQACAGDLKLRQGVEALLQAHDQAGEFMAEPAAGPLIRSAEGGARNGDAREPSGNVRISPLLTERPGDNVPPLREHAEDIPLLTAHFIARFNQEMKRQVRGVAPAAMELLQAYRWPGNIRELRNVVERAFILHANVDELRPEHLPPELRGDPSRKAEKAPPAVPTEGLVLEDVEKRLIREALERSSGNQSKAARLLGISRDTLRYRLKKHGMG